MSEFRQKAENFWYHYKFRVLLGAFLLFAFGVILYSCVSRPSADLQVFYITGGSAVYQEQLEVLQNALNGYGEDSDGNGAVEIAIRHYYVGDGSVTNDLITENRSQVMTSMQAGYCMLVIADKAGMEYLMSAGILDDLSDILPETSLDGYGWLLTGSGFAASQEGFEVFDQELYLGLRVFDGTVISASGKSRKTYESARELLIRIAGVPQPEQ